MKTTSYARTRLALPSDHIPVFAPFFDELRMQHISVDACIRIMREIEMAMFGALPSELD